RRGRRGPPAQADTGDRGRDRVDPYAVPLVLAAVPGPRDVGHDLRPDDQHVPGDRGGPAHALPHVQVRHGAAPPRRGARRQGVAPWPVTPPSTPFPTRTSATPGSTTARWGCAPSSARTACYS